MSDFQDIIMVHSTASAGQSHRTETIKPRKVVIKKGRKTYVSEQQLEILAENVARATHFKSQSHIAFVII